MLLITSYLLASIDDAYPQEEPSWLETTISKPSTGTELAVLRTTPANIVAGDAHRSLDGRRLNLDVTVAGLPKPKSGSYSVYLVKRENPDNRLYIARFGDPQEVNGKSTYRLSGWGPDTWLDYDDIIVTDGSSPSADAVLQGQFIDQL
jgi:hypothetical protein